MRYEKPECVLLGEAKAVVLGGKEDPIFETVMSSIVAAFVGYDE